MSRQVESLKKWNPVLDLIDCVCWWVELALLGAILDHEVRGLRDDVARLRAELGART